MTSQKFGPEYWEAYYREHAGERGAGHGPSPSPYLVPEAADLPPGRALDVGCGHGADAFWLASRGWHVTAVDVSPTALAHARDRAAEQDDDVATRVTWHEANLVSWEPPEAFDLVTSHYVHVPATDRDPFVRRLGAAAAPGGVLLLVGHDLSGLHDGAHGTAAEAYVTVEEVAALLDPAAWDVNVAAPVTRAVPGPNERLKSLRDAVLRATRSA